MDRHDPLAIVTAWQAAANVFVSIEPLRGYRHICLTDRRTSSAASIPSRSTTGTIRRGHR